MSEGDFRGDLPCSQRPVGHLCPEKEYREADASCEAGGGSGGIHPTWPGLGCLGWAARAGGGFCAYSDNWHRLSSWIACCHLGSSLS